MYTICVINQMHKPAGVRTNQTEWTRIMGPTFFGGAHLPLLYVQLLTQI